MRIIRKVILVLLALLIASQVPFVYRRYEIGKVTERVATLERDHIMRTPTGWTEYKGIIHAHTNVGGHSTGTVDELVTAANDVGLDFVLMTEHYAEKVDTSALTPNGLAGKTLFVNGNEIDTGSGDRLLMIPGAAYARDLKLVPTADIIRRLHAENRLALVTYPERFTTWTGDIDGIEVFSLHTELEHANKFTWAFDELWSGRSWPLITIAQYLRRPTAALAQYDRLTQQRRAVLFAGNDAHSNIGIHLFGDDAGHKYFNLKIDPYRVAFGVTQMHVVLPTGQPLDRDNLLAAIKSGHFYSGIEALGSTSGFAFSVTGDTNGRIMGDEVPFSQGLMLQAAAPQAGRIVVLKNGVQYADSTAGELAIRPDGPGVFRVEVYRPELGEPFSSTPWIMSNPIYIR